MIKERAEVRAREMVREKQQEARERQRQRNSMVREQIENSRQKSHESGQYSSRMKADMRALMGMSDLLSPKVASPGGHRMANESSSAEEEEETSGSGDKGTTSDSAKPNKYEKSAPTPTAAAKNPLKNPEGGFNSTNIMKPRSPRPDDPLTTTGISEVKLPNNRRRVDPYNRGGPSPAFDYPSMLTSDELDLSNPRESFGGALALDEDVAAKLEADMSKKFAVYSTGIRESLDQDDDFRAKLTEAVEKCAVDRVVDPLPVIKAILKGKSPPSGKSDADSKKGPVRGYLAKYVFPAITGGLATALAETYGEGNVKIAMELADRLG